MTRAWRHVWMGTIMIAAGNLALVTLVRSGGQYLVNPGMATGVGAGSPLVMVVALLAPVLLALAFIPVVPLARAGAVAAACAIGGALGNATDRLAYGGVTDYLPIPGTIYVANVADVLVVGGALVGLGVMLSALARSHRRHQGVVCECGSGERCDTCTALPYDIR